MINRGVQSADYEALRAMAIADMQADDSFSRLGKHGQEEYIKQHPGSIHAPGHSNNATPPAAAAPTAPAAKPSFAEHVKSLPRHVKDAYSKLSNNSKKAVEDWHGKTPAEKAKHVGAAAVDFAKTAAHNVGHVAKHEAHMYHGAGKALAHMAKGNSWSSLPDEHKSHFKKAMIHAGLTAADIGLTGGLHHAHGMLAAAAGVGAHHMHHSATIAGGEAALKTGQHYLKKAISMIEQANKKIPPKIDAEVQRFIDMLVKAEIPPEVWIEILQEIEREAAAKLKNKGR